MKIIAIANQKGGCGKTTSAINLSGGLSEQGFKVLLIDMDPQAHASFGLGISGHMVDKSIYNVLTDNSEKRRILEECIINASKNLDIVPSNILLSTLEQELKDKEDAVSKLHHALSGSDLGYDYIIIDCPPSLGFLTFNALRACDHVIVPIDMSAFSLMGVGKLLGMLELIKVKINHAPRVNALATLFDKRTKYSQVMLNEIKSFFKEELLETVIRTNVALKKAASKGVSVMQFDKESNGAADYMSLAREVTGIEGAKEFKMAMAEVSKEPARAVVVEEVRTIERKQPAPEMPETKEAIFRIAAPEAKDIYLVGDFNSWKINDESRLARLDGGVWEKRLPIGSGTHRYKFVVDGEWKVDSENPHREPNPYGTLDSIVKLD